MATQTCPTWLQPVVSYANVPKSLPSDWKMGVAHEVAMIDALSLLFLLGDPQALSKGGSSCDRCSCSYQELNESLSIMCHHFVTTAVSTMTVKANQCFTTFMTHSFGIPF